MAFTFPTLVSIAVLGGVEIGACGPLVVFVSEVYFMIDVGLVLKAQMKIMINLSKCNEQYRSWKMVLWRLLFSMVIQC